MFTKELKPSFNMQSDLIHTKLFTDNWYIYTSCTIMYMEWQPLWYLILVSQLL